MKKQNQNINELSLMSILRPLGIYWFFKIFGQLLINYQSYIDGRDYEITKALKKIIKNLQSDSTFIAKVDDACRIFGITPRLFDAIMVMSEIRRELASYKNDEKINQEELEKELKNILEKGMYSTVAQRAATKELENDLK
jgi:hypothetical protein